MAPQDNGTSRAARGSMGLPSTFRQPGSALERQISQAFSEVFNVDEIGVDDDFYDLGGDSLLGESLSMEILKTTGNVFQMSWFFDHGTPSKVSAKILGSTPQITMEQPPIFTVHGRGGYTVPKPSFHAGLDADQKLVMFELPGIRGTGPTYDSVEGIASDYVRQLQASYPEGPVLLAAFCTGGLIAVEMAAQLAQAGRPVHHMVLLDPGLPLTLHRRQEQEMTSRGQSIKGPNKKPDLKVLWRYRLRAASMRVGTFLVLGRASDGSTARDFADEKLHRWSERYFLTYFAAQRLYARTRGRVKHAGLQLRITPKAKMRAAFSRYWPKFYDGSVDIISSEWRRHTFEDPNQIWKQVLPRLKAHVTVAQHSDILAAEATATAAEMQAMFNESLKRSAPKALHTISATASLAVEPAE